MKRFFAAASIIAPITLLLLFWQFPTLDKQWEVPLLHFYLVTFFTFVAAAVAGFTAIALGHGSAPRHQLLAISFSVMGIIFFVHGITTPEALIFSFNPGIRWAAWLTQFLGGLLFSIAAFDLPNRRLPAGTLRVVNVLLLLACTSFVLIVAFRPAWLSAVDAAAAPWHATTIFWTTLLLWMWAAFRLWRTWRQTQRRIDGVMALVAAWLAVGTVSMHQFDVWLLSWWIYHTQLLAAAAFSIVSLVREYEQVQQFRLTFYYAAVGLVLTAGMALITSHLFSRSVEQGLIAEQLGPAEQTAAVLAMQISSSMPDAANSLEPLRGMEFGALAVLDRDAGVLFSVPVTATVPDSPALFAAALGGSGASQVIASETPLFEGASAARYVQAYVPVQLADGSDAVLTTVNELPGLIPEVITARLRGLLIAGSSLGILYLVMMFVLYRAERLIVVRNRELSLAYAELREAETLRDDLTSMIVHDLRTPLTSISLSLNVLEHYSFQNGAEQVFGRAKRSTTSMMTLIDQILDVARLQTGRLHPDLAEVKISRFLEDKAEIYEPLCRAEAKKLLLKLPDTSVSQLMDRALIGRVLDNLVANAIKYTAEGGKILIGAATDDAGVRFQVTDDGEGFDPVAADKIFDKYYQVTDATGKALRRGTGLGLSFCRLAVEAHGGEIGVHTRPQAGSTFYFTLPNRAHSAA